MNHPDWLKEKKIVFPIQIGARRDKDLPGVPLWTEVAKTDEQRRILKIIAAPISLGRPFLAPPDVPADRLAALRKAFAAALKDPKLITEAKNQGLDITPVTWERMTEVIRDSFTAPEHLKARLRQAVTVVK